MFKFIEYKNFELFHSFLNQHPEINYQEITKNPLQEYQSQNELINPMIIKQSLQLPSQEYINIMHCSDRYIYLGSQRRIQIFDIREEIKLITRLEIQNSLVIQETADCLFIGQLEQVLLLEIAKDFSIIGQFKLGQVSVPISFLKILYESPKQLDCYEILLADLKGSSQKVKCNVFKLFNKRNVQFSQQELTQNGQIVEKEKSNYVWSNPILYELLVLNSNSEQYAFVLYLLHNRISIIRVNKMQNQTPILLYNLQNDCLDSGWACLAKCLDNDKQEREAFCVSYGNIVHMFMYDIQGGGLIVNEIGVKQLEDKYKITGLECCESDVLVVLFEDSFGVIHASEFKRYDNELHYLNQELKLKKFNGNFMLGLTDNTFEFLQLLDCRNLLQNWADQLEFRKAMRNAIRMMNGDLQLIKLSKSDQLSELLQKLAFTECLFLCKEKKLTTQSFSEIVKFLIQTKLEHYLFTIIKDVTQDMGQQNIFTKTIEDMIIQHQIPYIPDQQLYELCKSYQQNYKTQMIRNLVCSLDFSRISTAILTTYCDQMKMYDEMIYICQQSQDFVTPLVKLFGPDELIDECYKYILSILEGKSYQGKNLTDEQFTIAMRSLIQFLFVSENLIKFIIKDQRKAFEIVYQFYIGKAQQCIEQSRAEIVLKLQVDENDSQFFDFDEIDVKTQVHRKMYLILKKLEFPKSQIWIAYLTAKLLIQKFPFSSNLAFESIQILCRNYEFLLSLNKDIFLINQFLIRVMTAKQLTQQQLSDLEFTASIVKRYSLAYVFIFSLQQQYKKAFEAFKLVNNSLRELVFPWIQALVELRPMILNSQNDDFILEIIKYLITIDEQQTFKIIDKFFHQKHFQILNCFQKDFEDQKYFVNFITYLFQSSKMFLVNDQTKILYLKHLCKTQPKQVLNVIKNMNFPLDEALKLTLEFKINQAAAYILQISGSTKQALEIYITSFLKKIKKCVVLLTKKQTLDMLCFDKLNLKLEKIIQLILEEMKQNSQVEGEDDSTLWIHFVELYLKENKIRTFLLPSIPQSVKSLLSQYLSEYLARVSDRVQVSYIFDVLNQKYPELPVTVFRQTINRVVSKSHDDVRTLKETQIIQSNEKYQIIQQLKEINQSAWICNHICQRCQNHIIDSELAIAFTCSHVFHDYCVLKGFFKIPYCDTCESEISYKIQKERFLKQYTSSQRIQEQKFLQQMSVNKITLVTNQQQQQYIQQTKVDKKSLIKRFDYQISQKYDYSWI